MLHTSDNNVIVLVYTTRIFSCELRDSSCERPHRCVEGGCLDVMGRMGISVGFESDSNNQRFLMQPRSADSSEKHVLGSVSV